MDSYSYVSEPTEDSLPPRESDSSALDNLFHFKPRILRSKLEALASEIYARLTMWDRNLASVDDDKAKGKGRLSQFTHLARYRLREQQDVSPLRDSALRLEAQRREEDNQCWRDVVMVMRDFLESCEDHEQARNRSIFLRHPGSISEGTL